MSYEETIEDDLKRAKEILERGKDEWLVPHMMVNDKPYVIQARCIYPVDNLAAYKLLESLVKELEDARALLKEVENDLFPDHFQKVWEYFHRSS